ncbi:MAG: ExbD/TolR family protein [Gemmatimonadetes bacterium]|nr:ExbD/TolR family protein [Gemmatimonadota bacterium]
MAGLEHDVKDTNVMGDINVTPMVDVMLVLLIIFMVVTPLITAGFKAQLPQGEHLKSRPEEDTRVVLGIDETGNYFLNKRPIARETALNLLTAEFNSRPQDKVLYVKADKNLKYQEVLDVMDLARDAGARVIGAITEQTPGTASEDEGPGMGPVRGPEAPGDARGI